MDYFLRSFAVAYFVATILCPFQSAIAEESSYSPNRTNHVLFLGAGGEPPGDETIFDSESSFGGEYFKTHSWNRKVLYNGGHLKSEAKINAAFGTRSLSLTKNNTLEAIQKARDDLRAGKIKRGDQFLLSINTHGSAQEAGQLAHSVALTDSVFDMKELGILRDEFEKSGVKLAILDLSCHSGAAQSLGTSKTCVISATGPNLVALNSFGTQFFKKMRPGKNLEEVFLQARENAVDYTQPEISTEAGKASAGLLRPLAPHFGVIISNEKGVMESEYISELRSGCSLTQSANELQRLLKELDKIGGAEGPLSRFFRRIKEGYVEMIPDAAYLGLIGTYRGSLLPSKNLSTAVADYEAAFKQAESKLKAMEEAKKKIQKREESLVLQSADGNRTKVSVSWADLISIDYPRAIEIARKHSSDPSLSKQEQESFKLDEQYLRLAQKKAEELALRHDKSIDKFIDARDDYDYSGEVVLNARAMDVAAAERKAFGKLYSNKSMTTKAKPNPCRNFTL